MNLRYARNIPALSEEECHLLKTKRIFIAGCGGTGGHLLELLARIGIGSIRAVDNDIFDVSNFNRQSLSEPSLIGVRKADAAALRVTRINPDVNIEGICAFIDENNVSALLEGVDVVFDALDNIESRKTLAKACSDAGIPYIYGAVQGWVAQCAIFMPGDYLMDRLYPTGSTLTDSSILSFTPALCASVQVSLCIKYLTGHPIETGKLYYFDLLNQEFETIPLR